jgi:hypothetical protein
MTMNKEGRGEKKTLNGHAVSLLRPGKRIALRSVKLVNSVTASYPQFNWSSETINCRECGRTISCLCSHTV